MYTTYKTLLTSFSSELQQYRILPYALVWYVLVFQLRARLQQVSESMLRQICNDAIDSIPIENNGVAREWGCNTFSSDSIVFIECSITSVTAKLSHHWC